MHCIRAKVYILNISSQKFTKPSMKCEKAVNQEQNIFLKSLIIVYVNDSKPLKKWIALARLKNPFKPL